MESKGEPNTALEETSKIRQEAMERAAAIWETFEHLPQPIEPVNIYKAVCAVKCSEFVARVRRSPLFDLLASLVAEFLNGTIEIGDNGGSIREGKRALAVVEGAMPLTPEAFGDPAAYAVRQHVYDGIIMLSAAKMGKEKETRECIDRLTAGIGIATAAMIFFKGDLPGSEPA